MCKQQQDEKSYFSKMMYENLDQEDSKSLESVKTNDDDRSLDR